MEQKYKFKGEGKDVQLKTEFTLGVCVCVCVWMTVARSNSVWYLYSIGDIFKGNHFKISIILIDLRMTYFVAISGDENIQITFSEINLNELRDTQFLIILLESLSEQKRLKTTGRKNEAAWGSTPDPSPSNCLDLCILNSGDSVQAGD